MLASVVNARSAATEAEMRNAIQRDASIVWAHDYRSDATALTSNTTYKNYPTK